MCFKLCYNPNSLAAEVDVLQICRLLCVLCIFFPSEKLFDEGQRRAMATTRRGASQASHPQEDDVEAMVIALEGESSWWLFLPERVHSTSPKWTEETGWWLERANRFQEDQAAAWMKPGEILFRKIPAKDRVQWDAIVMWVTIRAMGPVILKGKAAGAPLNPAAAKSWFGLLPVDEQRMNATFAELLAAEKKRNSAGPQGVKPSSPTKHELTASNLALNQSQGSRKRNRRKKKTKKELAEERKQKEWLNRSAIEAMPAPLYVMLAEKRGKMHKISFLALSKDGTEYLKCVRLTAEGTSLNDENVFVESPPPVEGEVKKKRPSYSKYDILSQRKSWHVPVEDWAVSPASLTLGSGTLKLHQINPREWLQKRKSLEECVKLGPQPLVLPTEEDESASQASTAASKRRYLSAAERRQRDIDDLSYLAMSTSSDEAESNESDPDDMESSSEESSEGDDDDESSDSEERQIRRRAAKKAARTRSISRSQSMSQPRNGSKKPKSKKQRTEVNDSAVVEAAPASTKPTKKLASKVADANSAAPETTKKGPTETLVTVGYRMWAPKAKLLGPDGTPLTVTEHVLHKGTDEIEYVTIPIGDEKYVTIPKDAIVREKLQTKTPQPQPVSSAAQPVAPAAAPATSASKAAPTAAQAATGGSVPRKGKSAPAETPEEAFMKDLLKSVQAAKKTVS